MALLCVACLFTEGRRRRLRRSLWRGRWGRRASLGVQRGADLEVASRWYGRNGFVGPLRSARRFVGGATLVALAVGQGPDIAALGRLA
jgi:hypothetical protein